MEWCGVNIDAAANEAVIGRDGKISSSDSKLDIFVVHTDEEAIIARQTARIIGKRLQQ
jgi:acetate kinase